MGEQPVKAVFAVLIALPAGHAVQGIGALVALVAGKDVQISAVQPDAVGEQLGEVAADIGLGLGGAQVGLRAARPSGVLGVAAVRQHGGVGRVEGRRVQIVVAVLVMDAEQVAQLVHGVAQLLHALPAAGFGTGGQIVRVLVVIARLRPSVEMQVHLLDAKLVQIFHLPGSGGEGGDEVVLLRIFRVIEIGLWIDIGLDAAVNKAAADQVVDRGHPRGLLRQRGEQAVLLDIAAVDLAQVVVVAAV